MNTKLSRYWIYQFIGWGLFVVINIFFALAFKKFNFELIGRLALFVTLGLIISHLMRFTIIRTNLLVQPLHKLLAGIIAITLFFALTFGCLESLLTYALQLRSSQENNMSEIQVNITNAFPAFVYLSFWNCIYLLHYYYQKSHSLPQHT